jgi:mono/diheme cytochrome c family protein
MRTWSSESFRYGRFVLVPLVIAGVIGAFAAVSGRAEGAERDARALDAVGVPDGPANPKQVLQGRELVIHHGCGDCHGGFDNPAAEGWLAGVRSEQQIFQIGPFKTYPRNLTPDNATGTGRFSERQIFNALRYGLRPGETPDVEIRSGVPGQGNFPARPKYLAPPMPWQAFRHMADEDLWAIAAYLKHGVKPVSNRVQDSEGPPDFWASEYAKMIGPLPAPAFPTTNERVMR